MGEFAPDEVGSIIDSSRIPLECEDRSLASQVSVGFAMQDQCHSNWCWAAVAASVATFYNATTLRLQCTIANEELQRSDCCDSTCHAAGVAYKVVGALGSPLNRAGLLTSITFGWITRLRLQQDLEAMLPVCVRTEWSGGGGHFVVIAGYSPESDTLTVCDPLRGVSALSFDTFRTSYTPSQGRWTHTYHTQAG